MTRAVPGWLRRRAIGIALVAILIVVTFEIGVHSAHHLDTPDAGATCAVASAAGHLTGQSVERPSADRVVLVSSELAIIDRHCAPDIRPRSPHQGRAPPPLRLA